MVKLEIKTDTNYNEENIKDAIALAFPVEKSEIKEIRILKKVLKIDAKKEFVLTLGVEFSPESIYNQKHV